MKKILTSTLILVAITLIAGLSLATVYEVTKTPIANAEQAARENAYRMVMPQGEVFTSLHETSGIPYPVTEGSGIRINDCLSAAAKDPAQASPDSAGTRTVGYVVNVTSPNGYGGEITLAVGILDDGAIAGISVISQSETAGLGAVCAEERFTAQFAGIRDVVSYVKDGKTEPNQIDAISGATITTKAVTEAVNHALAYVSALKGGKD